MQSLEDNLAVSYDIIQWFCSLIFTQMNRKLCPHESLHTEIIEAFFIAAKTQKQPRFIKKKKKKKNYGIQLFQS